MPAGDNDRSVEVKAVAAAFMSVATVVVLLRCYVRGFLIKAFGWDDTMMVLAMAFYLMFSGCMIGGATYGTGRKFAVLTVHQRVLAMKYWWLCHIAYCFASIGCKVSICIFLMRITVKRLHIWLLSAVMAFTVLTGLLFTFVILLQCKPLEYFWTRTAFDPTIQGHCISIEIVIAMTYMFSAFAALCDFTVGILPIFIVRKLHIRKKTKMAVMGILGMACIASSAVIVRFPYVKTLRDPDLLYATVEIAIWSNIEAGLGIIAGSLATLRPLLRHWLGTSSSNGDYNACPFPGRSWSMRRSCGTRETAFPLGSLDNSSLQGRLRPDKVVTVTTVHAQHNEADTQGQGLGWRGGSVSSSEERLTMERHRDSEGRRQGGASMGIHRLIEVTQTSSDVHVQSTSVKEHV